MQQKTTGETKGVNKMIIPCKEYNSGQFRKYNLAVKEWSGRHGGFPQIAFYFFWNRFGQRRIDGFVSVINGSHLWFRTKKAALKYEKGVKQNDVM